MNIRIQGAWGEDGDIMTLYRNNEKIKEIKINGANEPPDTLLDFLIEFDISPAAATKLGIENTKNLDCMPKFDNNGTLVWIL